MMQSFECNPFQFSWLATAYPMINAPDSIALVASLFFSRPGKYQHSKVSSFLKVGIFFEAGELLEASRKFDEGARQRLVVGRQI